MTTPNEWTINALADATGLDRRTIRRRLNEISPARLEGKNVYYRGREAFPAIYEAGQKNTASLVEAEARFIAARAEREELKLQKERGNLLETEAIYKTWEAIVLPARQKLLALPTKVESQCREKTAPHQVKAILDREVDELLIDLSKPPDYEESPGSPTDSPEDL